MSRFVGVPALLTRIPTPVINAYDQIYNSMCSEINNNEIEHLTIMDASILQKEEFKLPFIYYEQKGHLLFETIDRQRKTINDLDELCVIDLKVQKVGNTKVIIDIELYKIKEDSKFNKNIK